MATSPLQQNTPSLSLDLSLGGLFSQPKSMHPQSHHDFLKRRKGMESEESGLESEESIRQHKRARREDHGNEDHASDSLCISSVINPGNIHRSYSLPTRYHEHSSLQLARNMRGFDGDSYHRLSDMKKSPVLSSHSPTVSCTSFVHAQATPSCTPCPSQKASCPSTSSLTLITPSLPSSSASTLETGSNRIINNMRPTKMKSSRGGKSCSSRSSQLENGDNLDEQSTTPEKLITELEAPQSRCGSNSDMVGSVGSSAAIPSTSSMMYTHPFATVPVQVPLSMPIQWGYALPYAVHYSSHMMPPLASEIEKSFISPLTSSFALNHPPENTSPPWIPFVPTSASGSRPEVLAASCNEGKLQDNQETPFEEDCGLALSTPAPSAQSVKVQTLSQNKEMSPAMVQEPIPRSGSDECTSAASSSWPLISTSSDACASPTRPLLSLTSPMANYSGDSHVQVDPRKPGPLNEACRSSTSKACSNISTAGDGVISHQLFAHNKVDVSKASSSCSPISGEASLVGNNLCGQSQCSISPRPKPTKTVRFSSCERELVQESSSNGKPMKTVRFSSCERELVMSTSNEDPQHASSSLLSRFCRSAEMGKSCKSPLVKKMSTWEGDAPLCSRIRHNGSAARRTTQQRQEDDGNANTRISSETSDQGDSAAFEVDGAGKQLEGKNAANLPWVSITCAGPNGKTIYGVMYITKSKQACLICSCHGTHMTPSEFVQHSGSTDLSNPERSIVVTGFSCVKQAV